MAGGFPDLSRFDIITDPTSIGVTWKQWIQRIDNFLVAFNIDDERRQKALSVYHGGKELHDIYDILSRVNDDYNDIKRKLSNYFEPKINLTFKVYNFCQMRQREDEPVD